MSAKKSTAVAERPNLRLIGDATFETETLERNRPYARSFRQRRQQILEAAWDLIAQRDGDNFTLTELSQSSGAALRTIYNAFTDKDGVIAQAVAAHYLALFENIDSGDDGGCSLAKALTMTSRVAAETCRVRAFSVTGARMYFSPRTSPKIVESLRKMPIYILKAWIRSNQADRKQIRAFGQEGLERSYANAQWGLVNDWSADRLDDRELSREMCCNLLLIASAFGNRAGRAESRKLGAALN
jgi:AcrR family transcriptional regulator